VLFVCPWNNLLLNPFPIIVKFLKRSGFVLLTLVTLTVVILLIAGGGFGENPTSLSYGGNPVLLLAHRGTPYHPENSLEGFKSAGSLGFKAIEMDIRFSSDGIPLVIHDEDGSRLLGVNKMIKDMSSSEVAGKRIIMNERPTLSAAMTLDQALAELGDDFIIYLDVKLHDFEAAKKVTEVIKKYSLQKSTLVANSNLMFTGYIEFHDPEINTVLEGFTPGKEWVYRLLPKNFKPDYLASFADAVNSDHLEWLRKNNLMQKRIVYGVSKADLLQTIDSGIEKIILDYDSSLAEVVLRYK
jgi:glycerophosphoryl diester phosphodiesterase